MHPQFNVYGIGNAIMDLQYKVNDADISRLGLSKSHMRLVTLEEQSRLLQEFVAQRINQASGGSAANTMIALAQLGGRGAYGCAVGDDAIGQAYLSELKELAIEVTTSPRKSQASGTCVVLITPDAERTMNTHLGASAEFSIADISEKHIQDSEWLFVEGYLFSTPNGRQAVEKAIEYAKIAGTKIAVTLSDAFIVNEFRQAVEHAVATADLIFANVNETKALTGESEERLAFKKLRERVPNLVMTMSERGATVSYGGAEKQIAPVPAQAVDDTGAGDVFAGGFLYGITHGLDGEVAGKLGCLLGSTVVSQLGARLSGDVRLLAKRNGIQL